ncbi:MAG: redox-sensing transcriptional repressor Rex [Candidatus Coatesbacteria bacterium]|nr:MAG: redox-sensing transcriptional repressor Rex [Candidatus Coatesbacteria bacterium]
MSRPKKIPGTTVSRLSIYVRALQKLRQDGVVTTSSEKLAEQIGLTAAQIRKDLAYFGQFGVPGRGYYVENLYTELAAILGIDRRWQVALGGVGHLGYALLAYNGFKKQGFDVVVAFDKDPAKVGQTWEGVKIYDIAQAPEVLPQTEAQLGIIAVPAENAQEVCDAFVAGGLKSILSFAPERLVTPDDVTVKRVDLAMELEWLSYYATNASSRG